MKKLDELDSKILNILQKDASISTKELAAEIGLSFTPTYERVKRLENDGVIKKYVALVDRHKLGYGLMVYCNIVLKDPTQNRLEEFEKQVKEMPEILEVVSISGAYDFMLKIITKDIASYNNFVVQTLSNLPNIGQYHSNIVLNQIKKETAYLVNI